MDCGLAKLLCPWNFPDKNTGVGSHSLLQGIFPTQGSNPGLLHCRQTLYHVKPPRLTHFNIAMHNALGVTSRFHKAPTSYLACFTSKATWVIKGWMWKPTPAVRKSRSSEDHDQLMSSHTCGFNLLWLHSYLRGERGQAHSGLRILMWMKPAWCRRKHTRSHLPSEEAAQLRVFRDLSRKGKVASSFQWLLLPTHEG